MSRRKSSRKRIEKLRAASQPASTAEVAAQHTRRPDWAWFQVNVGTDKAHRAKKGKGSYSRKSKHPGAEQ